MEDEIKPPRLVSFFKWVLLVFGILTALTFLSFVAEPPPHVSFLILPGVATPLFFAAFFSLQGRKPYARWLACISFVFGTCYVTWGLFWYFAVYNGPRNTFATAFVIGSDIVQF